LDRRPGEPQSRSGRGGEESSDVKIMEDRRQSIFMCQN